MRLGWIGVGKMGSPMVRAVLAAGHGVAILEPLMENRASAVAAGARVALSVEQLATEVDAVVTTVAEDSVLHELVFAEGGLAQHLDPGQILVDASTVSPRLSGEIARVFEARSVPYLRAPVSGSTLTARSARLTTIVSGPKPAWRRMRPILDCFSSRQFWVGEQDEARFLKLALNVLVGGTSALLSEALAIGRSGGLSLEVLMAVICQSAISSPLLDYKRNAILADDYEPSFSIDQMIRDFELISEVAHDADLPRDLTDGVRRRFEAARRSGRGSDDFFVLVRDGDRDAPRRSSKPSDVEWD